MKFCVMLFLLASSIWAGEPANEIPKDIVPVLAAYEADAKKAWDAYQAALQKAEEKAKKDFAAKMAPALKKGDLDTANAIKANLDRVVSGEAVAEYEVAWKANRKDPDLLGDKVAFAPKLIIGTWTAQFSDGYTGRHVFGDGGVATNEANTGTWKIEGNTLTVTWTRGGYVDRYEGPPKNGKLVGTTNTGNRTVTLTKN